MTYRITHKLAKKIKKKATEVSPVDPNPFLEWSANHFIAGDRSHIVLMHNPTILSLYFYSKGVANGDTFMSRANENIKGVLGMYGFHSVYHTHIEPHLDEVQFSKVGDRKLSGILAELVWHAKYLAKYYNHSPYELTTKLNKMPQCSRKESWPVRAFEKLLVKSLSARS